MFLNASTSSIEKSGAAQRSKIDGAYWFQTQQRVQKSQFPPKLDLTVAISQKSTVHFQPLHPHCVTPAKCFLPFLHANRTFSSQHLRALFIFFSSRFYAAMKLAST